MAQVKGYMILLDCIKFKEGGSTMKETIHTKNSFRSADVEHLRKAVTEKIEKLVNRQVKRKNY
jgi:hypothetical protein